MHAVYLFSCGPKLSYPSAGHTLAVYRWISLAFCLSDLCKINVGGYCTWYVFRVHASHLWVWKLSTSLCTDYSSQRIFFNSLCSYESEACWRFGRQKDISHIASSCLLLLLCFWEFWTGFFFFLFCPPLLVSEATRSQAGVLSRRVEIHS